MVKTIQFGNRKLELPLVKIKDSPLSPYNAYNRMCTLVPADVDDPAFLIPQAKSNKILCYSIFQKKLRDILEMCGLDSSKFSSHSFRRGGATWAFHSKVPSELIQFHGDWRSDAYKVYLIKMMVKKAGLDHYFYIWFACEPLLVCRIPVFVVCIIR
ncbi:unnamed protein product [Mytilus coruscus]|uniref:Tyr recombinase domain-containing protein n=1 Tax=Mytilus coruscus TaxID=42192 RepID=A0A6J8AEV5_MYTCO|nr:unnamed protein product [Mytilus coruscus]